MGNQERKSLLTPRLLAAIAWEAFIVRFKGGSVNVIRTRQRFGEYVATYMWSQKTGLDMEVLMADEGKKRYINWGPINEHADVADAWASAKEQPAKYQQAVSGLLDELLNEYVAGEPWKSTSSPRQPIEIDEKVKKKVIDLYKKGEDAQVKDEDTGKTSKGKHVKPNVVQFALAQMAADPDELSNLQKQLAAIYADEELFTSGFMSGGTGRGKGWIYIGKK